MHAVHCDYERVFQRWKSLASETSSFFFILVFHLMMISWDNNKNRVCGKWHVDITALLNLAFDIYSANGCVKCELMSWILRLRCVDAFSTHQHSVVTWIIFHFHLPALLRVYFCQICQKTHFFFPKMVPITNPSNGRDLINSTEMFLAFITLTINTSASKAMSGKLANNNEPKRMSDTVCKVWIILSDSQFLFYFEMNFIHIAVCYLFDYIYICCGERLCWIFFLLFTILIKWLPAVASNGVWCVFVDVVFCTIWRKIDKNSSQFWTFSV